MVTVSAACADGRTATDAATATATIAAPHFFMKIPFEGVRMAQERHRLGGKLLCACWLMKSYAVTLCQRFRPFFAVFYSPP